MRHRGLLLAALTVGACALAAVPAAASTLLSAAVGNPFSSAAHASASKATSLRSAKTGALASAAFARPPQPHWKVGLPIQDAPVLRSHNGLLKVTLNVVRKRVQIAGASVLATTYNGIFAGPTLMVHLGDRMVIKVVNTAGKTTHQDTNFHFHGFHVSPSGNHDNIFLHIAPGKSKTYEVRVGKGNYPGTYWYHSHMHGVSEAQLVNGLSGLIMVEGTRERLPKAFRHITEHNIAMKTVQVTNGAIPAGKDAIYANADSPDPPPAAPIPPNTRLVDGQLQPVIHIRPGEVQLWHIANIGADVLYKLQLQNSHFTVIAEDAHAFDHPQNMKTLFMGGGQRFDVLVTGPTHGVTRLRTIGFDVNTSIHPPTRVLATLVSSGKPMKTPAMPTKGIEPFHSLAHAKIAKYRTFTFSNDMMGGGEYPRFTINGNVFDMNRVDVHAKLGTVEQWTLRNVKDGYHPFHIHVDAFQVMSIDGKPFHAHSRVDTFVLPRRAPGEPVQTMVIRIPFEDYTGKFVFHCHILGHEDLGMMQTIEVSK